MSGNWIRCTQSSRCPVCDAKQWCSVSASDPDTVCCMHTESVPPGWHLVKQQDRGMIIRRGERRQRSSGPSLAGLMKDYQFELSAEIAEPLLEVLGDIPLESIRAVGAGLCTHPKYKGQGVYAFPEYDGRGNIIGITLQTRSRDKWCLGADDNTPKSRRGLSVPDGLSVMPDPVLIVEGPTDVAACHWCGVAAVGRPSNIGGAAELAQLLRGREVIIVGEFDVKQSGEWPGRDGAVHTARKLAAAWGRSVKWAMTPNRIKDIRQWILKSIGSGHTPEATGMSLLARLVEHATEQKAGAAAHPDQRNVIANVVEQVVGEKNRVIHVTIPLPQISDQLLTFTGGWPRRVRGVLFTCDLTDDTINENDLPDSESCRVLAKTEQLFGWVHSHLDVHWSKEHAQDGFEGSARTPVTKNEFASHLRQTAEPNYDSIQTLPHEPPLPSSFYVPCKLRESDGLALQEFVDHLNPETDVDRDLMLACFLTMGWGGPPGRRPAFVFTSRHGQGSGKTTTAEFFAKVWGGFIKVDEHEDWERVRTRLLADEALTKRIVIIDNIRGKMARAGLESAITGESVDGHRMYHGQYTRPNHMTWLLTANTPALSKDLAERSVVLSIGAPRHADDFITWSSEFLDHRRPDVIADVLARLRKGPVVEIDRSKYDRWGPWIDGVLRTFPNAEELLDAVREGRKGVDQDLADAERVRDTWHAIFRKMRYPLRDGEECLRVPKKDFRDWLAHEGVIAHNKSLKATTQWLDMLLGLEPLAEMQEDPSHAHGRCWIWTAKGCAENIQPVAYDPQTDGPGHGQSSFNNTPPPPDSDGWNVDHDGNAI